MARISDHGADVGFGREFRGYDLGAANPGSLQVPHSTTRRRARATTVVLVAAVAVAATLAPGSPAARHGDEGEMEVLTAEPSGTDEISVEVGLVYANDDDLAEDAVVTVTATGSDGTSTGPIDVPRRDDAVYALTFAVPGAGTWTLDFVATEPAAVATAEVTTGEQTSTTDNPTTTDDPTTTDSTEAPSTSAITTPSTVETGNGDSSLPATVAGDDTDEGDDDGSAVPWIVGG